MEEKIKYGIFAVIIIIVQSFLKLYGVITTGSLSFLSETVDTLTDFVFVSITLLALSRSQKPPDMEHMYGHSKIDSVGAMTQGIILMILYSILIGNAILTLNKGGYTVENPEIGLLILIISFSINIIFSRILIRKGKNKKSLTLQIQGLNLFQDSMRAILVIISFVFILFKLTILDIFFSIILSIWIIIGAFKLTKRGINELSDTNPVNIMVIEELRQKIINLEHVINIEDIKIRAYGTHLFLEVHLLVEDHISIVHAHEITKSIKSIGKDYFPPYEVECIIEMNPISGEKSIGEKIINLIYSLKTEYPEIIKVKDLNLFRIDDKYYLSQTIVVSDELTLKNAHNICSNFELEIKKNEESLSRIATHIEGKHQEKLLQRAHIDVVSLDEITKNEIQKAVESILRSHLHVKGYHGFEFWTAHNYCILEMHVFFEDKLNISEVHEYIEELEKEIKNKLKIDYLQEVILHSEPLEGRTNGIIFDSPQ